MYVSNPFKVPQLTRARESLDALTTQTDKSIGILAENSLKLLVRTYGQRIHPREGSLKFDISGLSPVALPRYGLIARTVQLIPEYCDIEKGTIELSLAAADKEQAEGFSLRINTRGDITSIAGDEYEWYPTPSKGNIDTLTRGYTEANLQKLDLAELSGEALVRLCRIPVDLRDIYAQQHEWGQRAGEYQTVYQSTAPEVTGRLPLELLPGATA